MIRGELTKENLVKIAERLDGWKYHNILSEDPKQYGHWFSNGIGQFINVNYAYRENLPQWSLMYIHPKYKNRVVYTSIGCSINKSLSAIVSDLNSRLVSCLPELFLHLKKLTDDLIQDAEKKALDEYMIDALNRVVRLNEYHDHRFNRAFRIEKPKGETVATIQKYSNCDRFALKINEVTPEQIIQIMQIVNKETLR